MKATVGAGTLFHLTWEPQWGADNRQSQGGQECAAHTLIRRADLASSVSVCPVVTGAPGNQAHRIRTILPELC